MIYHLNNIQTPCPLSAKETSPRSITPKTPPPLSTSPIPPTRRTPKTPKNHTVRPVSNICLLSRNTSVSFQSKTVRNRSLSVWPTSSTTNARSQSLPCYRVTDRVWRWWVDGSSSCARKASNSTTRTPPCFWGCSDGWWRMWGE